MPKKIKKKSKRFEQITQALFDSLPTEADCVLYINPKIVIQFRRAKIIFRSKNKAAHVRLTW